MSASVLEDAMKLHKLGLSVIPLIGKRAAIGWKAYQSKQPTATEVHEWFASGAHNIGLLTGRIVVVDCESAEDARWFWRERGVTNVAVESPRGIHLYFGSNGREFGNAVKVEGRYDVRGFSGYVVAPGSVVDGKTYKFVDGYELTHLEYLPPFQPQWMPSRREARSIIAGTSDVLDLIARARAYVEKCDAAVSGAGGHATCFRVACKLVRVFGLSVDQAWPILLEYNERCVPPWSLKELRHKLTDAERKRK